MWTDISTERTILARAQQTVDRWRRSRNAGPFAEEVARSASHFWDDQPDSRNAREAFCKVAEAIRRSEGHAFRDREPLIQIVREAFRGTSDNNSDSSPSGLQTL